MAVSPSTNTSVYSGVQLLFTSPLTNEKENLDSPHLDKSFLGTAKGRITIASWILPP